MGNGDEQRKKHHKSRGSAQEPQIEQKQLWEINEVILNGNYTRGQTEDGQVYYTLSAARQDLPASFWYRDWDAAMETRAAAERLAQSSGYESQRARGVIGGNLLSQQIANNPNMGQLSSSAESSKKARKKKDGKK